MLVLDCPYNEGRLSYPGSFEACPRADWARVDGQALGRQPVSFGGEGLLARCLQHEANHTLVTVVGDRLSAKSRKRLDKTDDDADELLWPFW